MQDKKDIIEDDNVDKEFKHIEEEDQSERRVGGFILLFLITMVGIMLALGLSFSAIRLMDSNETINTLISSLTGDDNKDKYIITYVENTGTTNDNIGNGSIYISNATFFKAENGGSGEVTYFGGLLLTTKTTFNSAGSKITYEVTLTNSAKVPKVFYGLNFNNNSNINYTLTGIKEGDVIPAGGSIKTYITVEYFGNSGNETPTPEFPQTIESSVEYSFEEEDKSLYIEKAEVYKTSNDGTGEVIFYKGMMLTTKTTLSKENSSVIYKVTIRNDSKEVKMYNGINHNKNSEVTFKESGIKIGDTINPGSSKVFYLIVEGNDNTKYPVTIETTVELDFSDFGTSYAEKGIYLVNQFPTRDEVGKLFKGTNYVYSFSLLLGKKTEGAYYEVTVIPNDNNTLDQNYVKVYLEKNEKGVDLSYRPNGRVKIYTEYENSKNGINGKVIYKGYVTKEDVIAGKINFVMRMWISEDINLTEEVMKNYMNKTFSARVNVYATLDDGR